MLLKPTHNKIDTAIGLPFAAVMVEDYQTGSQSYKATWETKSPVRSEILLSSRILLLDCSIS